jgi:hypothetical protein
VSQIIEANPKRPKEPVNKEEVAAVLRALPPNTPVDQIGNIIASNVVREGAKQKAKKMTFEA